MKARRGIALLEVMVATVILGLAIIGWFSLVQQLQLDVQQASVREQRVRRASSALAFAATMPADSLARWGAGRAFAGFRIESRRLSGRTYAIVLRDLQSGAVEIETIMRVAPSAPESP